MTMAMTLRKFLNNSGVDYDVVLHEREVVSSKIAQAAHIHGDQLAKAVMLTADRGYLLAVVPSTHRVDLGRLSHLTGERLGLATEQELATAFGDCDPGAVPPCGNAYGIRVVLDDRLEDCADIYFEAGDHESLIHVSRQDFDRLMTGARHATISHHV